jgi:opacity protein-like surface antigen
LAKANFVHAQTATARDGGAVALQGCTCAAVARSKYWRQPYALLHELLGYNVFMKLIHISKLWQLFVVILACIFANPVFARCDPTIAKDYPGAVPPNYYGNSQTDSFRCAVSGSTDLTSMQASERAELIPEKLSNRYYLMLGGNAASEGIERIKNNSIYDATLNGASVSSTSIKTASNNIEFGFGYEWKEFALDLEWIGVKSMTYNGTLLDITPILPYSTSLKGDAWMFNLSWFFSDQYNFKMYGLMCLGLSKNKTTATLNGGSPTVTNKWSPAYGIGFGARFNVISRLFADMVARYMILGRVKYAASNGGNYMILKGYRTWLGVSARLIWMI